LAITDHSKSSFQAHGLEPARLREQLKEVQKINQKLADEGIDFRRSPHRGGHSQGQAGFDDDLLRNWMSWWPAYMRCFSANEADNTARIIRAAQNPNVHMLGHLTGRLLLEREAYKVNQQAIIDVCAETGRGLN